MNLSLDSQTRGAKVGNLYGWAIGFLTDGAPAEPPTLLITSNDYHAAIDAVLPSGLSGGRVQVVIDAVKDAHYTAMRACKAADLYLFWQDVNASFLGYAASITGLAGLAGGPSAADLAPALITRFAFRMKRRPGARAYETVLEGRDNAFHRLSRTPAPRACFPSLAAALTAIGSAAAVTITPEPSATTLLGQALAPEDEQTDAAAPDQSCAVALDTIAQRIAAGSATPEIPALRRDAPSVVLLRDGAVHVGRRPIPYPSGSERKELNAGRGLVEATREGEAGETAPVRWTLLCRGRPDIKPGDVIDFKSPPEDVITTLPGVGMALIGALAGPLAGPILGAVPEPPDTAILVTDVAHRMSRTTGFVTSVSGTGMLPTPGIPPWLPFHTADGLVPTRAAPGGDPAVAVGRQVRELARAALGRIRLPEVAEVRSAVTKAGSPPEPPAQTVTVWEGTGGDTAQANPSRRLPIRRTDPYERRGVATVTPFAWGACGLSVPRYPGMRVVLGYGGGRVQDPLDLGALWGPGARMDAEPGDWFLKLPVDQPTAAISDTQDHLPSGKAVNDLTTAAGVRVIEVGKLTIRVGTPLPDLAARPAHKAAEAVSIEHADGKASITIDQDGKITLTGKTIALKAADGTISLEAKTVSVSVSDKMTVGG